MSAGEVTVKRNPRPPMVTVKAATALEPLEVTVNAEDVTVIPELTPAQVTVKDGWRIEVTARGRYWQFRERKRNGRSQYGGKFKHLSPERKSQYEQTKAERAERATHRRGGGLTDSFFSGRVRDEVGPALPGRKRGR